MENIPKYWKVTCISCDRYLGIAKAPNGVEAISMVKEQLRTHLDHMFGAIETKVPSHNVENLGCVIYPHILNPPKRRDK